MFLISSRYFVIVLWISCCVIDNILFFFMIAIFSLFLWGIQWLFCKVSALWKALVPSKWHCSVCSSGLYLPRWKLSLYLTILSQWLTVEYVYKLIWVHSLRILLWGHLDGSFCGNSSPWRHKVSLGVFFLVGPTPQKTTCFSPKRWGLPARLCLSLLHMVPTSQFCQM